MREKAGFTLVEILIVVAIIAVVAAIAVPNIMSANIRAKVSGVRSDMGSIAIALEDYRVDKRTYPVGYYPGAGYDPDVIGEAGQPFDGTGGNDSGNDAIGLGYLVYPVTSFNPTYLKRIPGDPFNDNGEEDWPDGTSEAHNHHYCYFTGAKGSTGTRINGYRTEGSKKIADYWALASYGPDKKKDVENYLEAWKAVDPNAPGYDFSKAYDSDRGITSSGDIIIIGP